MANRVVDLALDKISKKYPNFSADSGKKVVDSLQDAYKSYQSKRKLRVEVKSAAENHALIDIPNGNGPASEPLTLNHETSNRDSVYDDCEEFFDTNSIPNESTENFREETPLKSQTNGIRTEEDSSRDPSYQRLSENPSQISADSAASEKNELVGSSHSPENTLEAPVKPPDAPNISQYLQKKSMAQGMMDLALLSANTNQLRYILDSRSENSYFSVSLMLIISSLVLQIVVGLMLVWNSQYNVQRKSGFASADRINNLSVFGIFLITLINVFVSTFGNVSSSGSAAVTTTTIAPGSSSTSAGAIIETTTVAAILPTDAASVPTD